MMMYKTRIHALLFVLVCATTTQAQTSFCSSCLSNFRAYNNTSITTKTYPGSVTPINVGGNIDSACRYIGDAVSAISGSAGLQGTLNAGNTASDAGGGVASMQLNSLGIYTANIAPTEFKLYSSTKLLAQLTGSSFGILNLGSPTANYAQLKALSLSANRTYTLPDESGNIVVHTTNTPIHVNAGTNDLDLQQNQCTIDDISSGVPLVGAFASSAHVGALLLKDCTTPSTNYGYISAGSLTGNRTYTLPDYSGNFQMQVSDAQMTVTNGTNATNIGDASVTVTDGAGHTSNVVPTSCFVTDATNGTSTVLNANFLDLTYQNSGTSTNVANFIKQQPTIPSGSTANYNNYLPLDNGTLTVGFGGSGATTASGTSVTINIPSTGGHIPTRVFLTAQNLSTAQMLASGWYLSAISSSSFTISFITPQSGAFSVYYQCF